MFELHLFFNDSKRSDLQLSGCHLVDAPHHGRKEVADKMIIVDSMQFAFSNPDGATLCFITGDIDYAYMLSVLKRPQWRVCFFYCAFFAPLRPTAFESPLVGWHPDLFLYFSLRLSFVS